MGTTSYSLGPYLETFIKSRVYSGRCGSATGVVRAALRPVDDAAGKFARLKAHIDAGMRQAEAGKTLDGPTAMAAVQKRARESQ